MRVGSLQRQRKSSILPVIGGCLAVYAVCAVGFHALVEPSLGKNQPPPPPVLQYSAAALAARAEAVAPAPVAASRPASKAAAAAPVTAPKAAAKTAAKVAPVAAPAVAPAVAPGRRHPHTAVAPAPAVIPTPAVALAPAAAPAADLAPAVAPTMALTPAATPSVAADATADTAEKPAAPWKHRRSRPASAWQRPSRSQASLTSSPAASTTTTLGPATPGPGARSRTAATGPSSKSGDRRREPQRLSHRGEAPPAPSDGVAPGLDPGVYRLRKTLFANKMDCRVKPANDDLMRTLFHAAGSVPAYAREPIATFVPIGDARGREHRDHVGRQEDDIGVGLALQRRLMNVKPWRYLDRNAALAPEHLRARAQAVELEPALSAKKGAIGLPIAPCHY